MFEKKQICAKNVKSNRIIIKIIINLIHSRTIECKDFNKIAKLFNARVENKALTKSPQIYKSIVKL